MESKRTIPIHRNCRRELLTMGSTRGRSGAWENLTRFEKCAGLGWQIRELRFNGEMSKLLNRKIAAQNETCALCNERFGDYADVVLDHEILVA